MTQPPPPGSGGPYYQQGPGMPPAYGPPPHPPRRRRTGLWVLLGLVASVTIVAVVVGTVLVVFDDDSRVSSAVPSARTTRAPANPPSTRTTKPTTPPTKKSAPKRNVLTKNNLYDAARVGSVSCRESNAPLSSKKQVLAYYSKLKKCLDKTWPKIVEKAGYGFQKPKLTVFTGSIDTPCGPHTGRYSFYCSGRIYMYLDEVVNPWRQYPYPESRQYLRLSASHAFMHEYAHHIQNLTGILPEYGQRRASASSAGAAKLERQLELQASCLANAVLSANKNSYPVPSRFASDWRWRTIAVSNHGTKANQEYWMKRGYSTRKPGKCNTFAASSSLR